jgi:DNA-binding response OmpR family regulator
MAGEKTIMVVKVLVVEDKESLNRTIVNMLRREGYIAFSATDMSSSKRVFIEEMPHIILLDIMLPGGNGYDLIPFFRKHGDSNILMLSALNDELSKRISYENGADDYISKPFDLYELIYKLEAMKRRIISNLKVYQVGDIIISADNNTLTCKGVTVAIQPSQIKILIRLYEKYEEKSYLDKNEVVECLSKDVDESCRVQTLLARLRKNLLGIGSETVYIETLYGKGYKLVVSLPRVKNG